MPVQRRAEPLKGRGRVSADWLARALRSLPAWPYGDLRSAGLVTIGQSHGLSGGTLWRVAAKTTAGDVTFVLKQDDPEAVHRALLFHQSAGDRLTGTVPLCFGGVIDSGDGYLFLEDVTGEQGDVLVGCADDRAIAAVRAIARIHASSWATDSTAHGPLLRALRDARALDPELNAVWQEMEEWRLRGQGRLAGLLAERGELRPGLSVDEARDIIWTLCSLAVHDLLVLERGWPYERYEDWLASSLTAALLPG